MRLNDEKDAHARRRGHPFDLGLALFALAHEFAHRCGHEDFDKRAEEIERLGRENSLPMLWAKLAPMAYGLAFIREGKVAEGIAPLKAAIAVWEATGIKLPMPILKALLAEAMALTGDLENALHLIDEAIAQVERPGWEERLSYAESQQAKFWELRTSNSLARLWQSQGKRQDAYELLAPV